MKNIPADIRAEMDGQPAPPQTLREWTGSMSEEEQAELFGARAVALWRAGKLTTSALLEQASRPLAPEDIGERFGK